MDPQRFCDLSQLEVGVMLGEDQKMKTQKIGDLLKQEGK
jgi:hypothetical protein